MHELPGDAAWVEDFQVQLVLEAPHPRRHRVILEDVQELLGQTVRVEGFEDSRMHLQADGRQLWLHVDEHQFRRLRGPGTTHPRLHEITARDRNGRSLGISSRHWPDRQPHAGLPAYVLVGARRIEDVHQIELTMYEQVPEVTMNITFGRLPLPAAASLLDPHEAELVVAASADAPRNEQATPLRGNVDVFIEND